jgi:hypothetical protein
LSAIEARRRLAEIGPDFRPQGLERNIIAGIAGIAGISARAGALKERPNARKRDVVPANSKGSKNNQTGGRRGVPTRDVVLPTLPGFPRN